MKSGTFTNNTSFTASAAQVNVPTNSVDFLFRGEFIIPAAIRVVKARLYGMVNYSIKVDITKFIAVTPGKKYKLQGEYPYDYSEEQTEKFYYVPTLWNITNNVEWIGEGMNAQDSDDLKFTISWSPEINNHTPDVTDY
mgnify:FL=1